MRLICLSEKIVFARKNFYSRLFALFNYLCLFQLFAALYSEGYVISTRSLFQISAMLKSQNHICKFYARSCYSYKSPFPTLHYNRKRLQRIKQEQFVEGPPASWPRSFFPNWNSVAELRAFAFRIGEPMNIGFLRNAFVDRSFNRIPSEECRIRKLKVAPESDNSDLFWRGQNRLREIASSFLMHEYPSLPENALVAVSNYLLSEKVLSKIGRKLGLDDLIIAADYPYNDSVVHRSFCALVETIAVNRSSHHAAQFVDDFVCSELITEDIFMIWKPPNAEEELNSVLLHKNMATAEPRYMYGASTCSVLPAISICFFSDKNFLGSGTAESIEEAKNEAAINSMKFLLNSNWESKKPVSANFDRVEIKD